MQVWYFIFLIVILILNIYAAITEFHYSFHYNEDGTVGVSFFFVIHCTIIVAFSIMIGYQIPMIIKIIQVSKS
jgi:TRAP-type mannitol/chloroaromatic compound transport system permease small subunit